jgi:predicted dehydrogenase
MKRREALKSGLLIVSSQTAFGSQANSSIEMGAIGMGGRGRYVGGLFGKQPQVKLAAICDIFPDRLDQAKTQIPEAAGAKSYKDYRELLAQPGIDAVLIATPVFAHPEHFEAAARAGKHIYCEKPAGADVAGVKRLLAAAKALPKDRVVFFGFQQRFSPEYLAAEKMLRDGTLGDLNLMISYWIWGGNAFATPATPPDYSTDLMKVRYWHQLKELSGDFIVEQDCHGLDVLNWFALAHPVKAIGDGGRRARKIGDNTDHANVTYEYPGGLKGWLMGTQLPPTPYWDVKEQFIGTKGALETTRNYFSHFTAGKRDWVRVDSKREITNDAVEKFVEHVIARKPYSMAEDACNATFTALLGRLAMEKRREVTWDELLKSA